MQIAHPAQGQQKQRNTMVNEHLPEVLTFDVTELGYGQCPIEGHRDHVVGPNVTFNRLKWIFFAKFYQCWWWWYYWYMSLLYYYHYLMWIAIPAVFHIPEPWFVPQYNQSKYETVCIVHATPRILTEFNQGRWLILASSIAPPSLNLTLSQIHLLGQADYLRIENENEMINKPHVSMLKAIFADRFSNQYWKYFLLLLGLIKTRMGAWLKSSIKCTIYTEMIFAIVHVRVLRILVFVHTTHTICL